MKNILVTGANKGIGLAVVERILREQPDFAVILGARDRQRGIAAREKLVADNPAWEERLQVIALDVASDEAVAAATAAVTGLCPTGDGLYGIVNNAGLALGELTDILNVNVHGIERVCRHLGTLVERGGRIVNVTSASGPKYVSDCSAEWQRFFRNRDITWEQLYRFMELCRTAEPGELPARGLPEGRDYGLSKACANTLTLWLARQWPTLAVNACTPGFIETDLGREFLKGTGRTPADAGMKTPREGAEVVMSLLFDGDRGATGRGYYYGSDCQRSPLDRYRAPGSPPYAGD